MTAETLALTIQEMIAAGRIEANAEVRWMGYEAVGTVKDVGWDTNDRYLLWLYDEAVK